MGCKDENLVKPSWSCDQDGHHAHIWEYPLKIFFSETSRPMTFKLGIQHLGLGALQDCSNNDSGLTLTYFTTKLTLPPNAFVWENATDGTNN